jgi:hypothetical protein
VEYVSHPSSVVCDYAATGQDNLAPVGPMSRASVLWFLVGGRVTEVAVLEIRKTDKGANGKLSHRRGSPKELC